MNDFSLGFWAGWCVAFLVALGCTLISADMLSVRGYCVALLVMGAAFGLLSQRNFRGSK